MYKALTGSSGRSTTYIGVVEAYIVASKLAVRHGQSILSRVANNQGRLGSSSRKHVVNKGASIKGDMQLAAHLDWIKVVEENGRNGSVFLYICTCVFDKYKGSTVQSEFPVAASC